MVRRLPTCVRSGPIFATIPGTPAIVWQAMHEPRVTSCCPLAGSPRSDSSTVIVDGIGVRGMLWSASFSRAKPMNQACTGAGAAVGVVAVCGVVTGRPAAGVVPAAPGAPGAGTAGAALNAAGVCWCATQLSNCSGDTVNARKRMFACDVPQYSAQNPLNAPSVVESG